MAVTTVAQLATELKRPEATLLEQLESAGVPKTSASETLTEADKARLLEFLRSSHGTSSTERKKITLVRRPPARSSRPMPAARRARSRCRW